MSKNSPNALRIPALPDYHVVGVDAAGKSLNYYAIVAWFIPERQQASCFNACIEPIGLFPFRGDDVLISTPDSIFTTPSGSRRFEDEADAISYLMRRRRERMQERAREEAERIAKAEREAAEGVAP
jgi:hypothetical protein